MPYIKQEQRDRIDVQTDIQTPGELNYAITCLIDDYRHSRGDRYFVYNEIIGALDCAKLEFYRRVVTPYEDETMKENGDVYYDRNAVVRSKAKTGATAA